MLKGIRTMKYVRLIAFILLYLAVYFIVSNYISVLFIVLSLIKELVKNPAALFDEALHDKINLEIMYDYIGSSIWFMVAAAVISFPIYALILRLRKKRITKFCEFHRISFRHVAITALMGISLNFIVEYFVSVTSLDDLSPYVEQILNQIFDNNDFLAILISIGIVGPFIEEVIFRGLILNELRQNMPVVPAVIIQAILFGVYHGNLTQGIYATFLGIVMGLVCIKMNSIWAPVIIHMFFNSTSTVLGKLVDPQIFVRYQYLMLFGSVVLFIATSVMTWRDNERVMGTE